MVSTAASTQANWFPVVLKLSYLRNQAAYFAKTCIIVYPMQWIDPLISFFRLSVSQSVCVSVNRSVVEWLRPQFFTDFQRNFACGSQMWSLRRLVFVRETRSSLRILEVCGFRFWQFSGCGVQIFQQISTKSHIQIKFRNADFVFSGEWNRK